MYALVSLARLEVFLQQNTIMNMFDDDYTMLQSTDGIIRNKADANLKEYQSFADLQFSKKKVVTALEWHPTIKGQLCNPCAHAGSCVDLSMATALSLNWEQMEMGEGKREIWCASE